MTLTVIATIKANLGMEAQMLLDLCSLLEPTQAESGCINFDLLQDPKDSCTFVLYENWESQSDLDAHFQMPYVKRVLEAYKLTLAEPIQVMLLQKFENL